MSANILIQTAFLGDLLLSIPLMRKIKALWPEQKLFLVCRKGVGEFFTKTQLVDEYFEIKKGDADSYKKILVRLNEERIHRVFSPHESVRTAFFVRQIQAGEKISFSKWWNGFFYQQRIVKNQALPDAIRQLSLVENFDPILKRQIRDYQESGTASSAGKAGLLPAPPLWSSMSLQEFYAQQGTELAHVLGRFGLSRERARRTVALFPGSVWTTKRWTEAGFVQVGQELLQKKFSVLLMGGPGEEELCERLSDQIPGAQNICAQTSIYESALILSQLAAVVGNDSASMHLAATGQTPSVVIFGPTVLEFGFRPWQDHVHVVERKGLACRPCGKHGHQTCPLRTHECMISIHKEEVLKKLEEILK